MPLPHLLQRQAIRIPQSFPFLCLCSTSRTGRPHEYLKAFHSYASTSPVAAAGHTNTSKLPVHMPLPHQPLRQATRTLQSFPFLCLCSTSRTGRPFEYFKVFHSYASTSPVAAEGHSNTPKFSIPMPLPHQSYRKAFSQSQIQPSPVPGVSIRRDQWGSLHLRSGQRRPFSCSPCGRA